MLMLERWRKRRQTRQLLRLWMPKPVAGGLISAIRGRLGLGNGLDQLAAMFGVGRIRFRRHWWESNKSLRLRTVARARLLGQIKELDEMS